MNAGETAKEAAIGAALTGFGMMLFQKLDKLIEVGERIAEALEDSVYENDDPDEDLPNEP